ncbi:MAG TPA: hypothetical protein VMM35_03695 [Longimicrobiales bacterium]|nr:hypothetical protein [Longimicrobiales bacterium]
MAWIASMALVLTITASSSHTPPDSIWSLVDAAVGADEAHRSDLLRDLETRARAALAEDEASVARRYDLAVVLGARANTEGGQTKVRAAAELHEQLLRILELDPGHVGARHLLGRLHAGVRRMSRLTRWLATNLLGGGELKRATWEAAEENLVYAEARAPEVADHHLQLALLYRDTDRPELALEELRHVMVMQAVSALDLAVQGEASRVWAELQK